MRRSRLFIVFATVTLLVACGSDGSSEATTPSDVVVTTTQPAVSSTQPAATTTTHLPTTTAQPAVTTTQLEQLQHAIWPAADVVFDTPDAAGTDFLANVFGDGPMLGEFRASDSRSGEMDVFASVDGVPLTVARSVLLLRQLGPSDGWFVIAAVNDHATITVPDSESVVPAGPLTVEGVARGFEATVVVSAFIAGRADVEFDREITMAGNFEDALPYSVVLDLTNAAPADIVVLLVRGGTGLETDSGDFGAIPVVVGN